MTCPLSAVLHKSLSLIYINEWPHDIDTCTGLQPVLCYGTETCWSDFNAH